MPVQAGKTARAQNVQNELAIVLIGPPGVGKGTQAARLREEFHLAHIATGDLLRDHRARGTALGRRASECMTTGGLVPDDLVVEMVRERIEASERFLLDGFPRTLPQAHALTDVLGAAGRGLTAAVFVDAPDNVVVERIAGRRHCPNGHVFHIQYQPPRREGWCDHDDSALQRRDDDEPDTVRRRLEVFHRSTAPMLEYYEQLGLLHRLDASRRVSDVYADARRLLTTVTSNTHA